MGASGSKASKAAGSAARQYPTRPPLSSTYAATSNPAARAPPPRPSPAKPSVQAQASESRSEAINLDASDPDFARSLRSIGPVQPNLTLSPSSAFGVNAGNSSQLRGPDVRKNPAIMMLEARARLQDEADKEALDAGSKGHGGRQFLDILTIRRMLVMRDLNGDSPEDIEKSMGLKKGVVDRLGIKGVIELANEQGRARKEVDMV
ncbi:Hypothetical protein R9X50_00167900 [Acrodontium crateriforme]|uniref:Helix-turn-helix domain-containing protein n=1 Tax=Acrodontium crateriforme TaxID=150365 RepID=A0AAQ3M154_9PEZI|nr:Hypothetical protein R9X50_00167900 [Acrodontium crateriforme]